MFNREYDARTYNCTHFASDVWQKLTGEALSVVASRHEFREIDCPVDPCFVGARQRHTGQRHVGVWHKGRVLHIAKDGARHAVLPQFLLEYRDVRYYVCSG